MGEKGSTTIQLAEEPIEPMEQHLGAADTLRQWGPPTLLQRIRSIARGELGQHEEDGENWGPAIQKYGAAILSPERLASFAPGQKRAGKLQWCNLLAAWCTLEGLKADGRPPEQLREWRRLMSAEVPVTHERMLAAGYIAPFVPGEPPPPDTVFAFFRKLSHIAIVDETMGALVITIDGNSGPRCVEVYENKHALTDSRIDCWGRMPW